MADSLPETILKAVGMIGAAAGWMYQARATMLRGKIKTDLEILEKARAIFGSSDPRSQEIECKASKLISYLYSERRQRKFRPSDLSLGILCLLGAAAFAWSGIGTPLRLWEIALAGILAFIAFGAFLNAFDVKRPSPGA